MNFFDYLFQEICNFEKNLVLGPKETASYNKIYYNSLAIAGLIRSLAGENNNVLLISPNSVFFITVYLGIMKSGNAVIPLSPATEKRNLEHIIRETNARIAFIPKPLTSRIKLPGIQILTEENIPDNDKNIEGLPDFPDPDFNSERMAQILFTSGSTGIPKGVMLSHKNLIANTRSILRYLQLTEDDIMEVVLPFHYCYGLSLLHTHLKVGGSLVINNSFIFLGSVINDLQKYKCTGFAGVPSHFQILLRKTTSFLNMDLPHLRYVTQAGGKLHYIFIKEFTEAFPNTKFFVMYGQTEATARLSYLPPELIESKKGSIGKGIPDVTLKVVNEKNEPVSPGETGEIIARGDNIMIGYLNDPESTARILKNGWLHTGDLAQIDEDGFIYIVARSKEIFKVRGKRISLKEIEEVIVSVPSVVDCSIEGFDDELLGEGIKAVVVLKEGSDPVQEKENILETCKRELVPYKIPQKIEFVSNLRINESGKKIKDGT